MSSLRLPLWLCFFAALETGCSSGDLVVFETQAPGQGGDTGSPVATTDAWDAGTGLGGSMPDACVSGTDCSSFWLCSKANCQAQSGVCQPRPLFCPPEPDPVCGCDGVTYWNDCVRQQIGVPASTLGECQSGAIRCRFGADCGFAGAHCARLLFPGQGCPQSGSVPELGTCWSIPPNCSDEQSAQRWYLCPFPDAPPPAEPICGDTCQAIRSELVHLRDEPVCRVEP